MKSDRSIYIISYYHFPCTHPMLENVFAKELGREHEIFWLLQGDVSGGKQKKWLNSNVFLTRAFDGKNWYSKIKNRIYSLKRINQIVCLLRNRKDDIVLIRDLPFIAFIVSFFKVHMNFRLFYQCSSPQHEISLAAYKVNKSPKRFWYLIHSLIYGFFLNKVLKKSDLIFPISDFHAKKLLPICKGVKLVTLTMGVDDEWLNRQRKEIPFLKKISKRNFILVYFGSLSFVRNPIFIVDIFAKVKKKISNCKLLLIGETSSYWEFEKLKAACCKARVESDVILTGKLNRNELQDYLAYCNLSISAIAPSGHYKISSPTKVYESLGNGIPVIGNEEIHEQKKVIEESGAGIYVKYDLNSFSKAIIKLLNNKELRETMSKKGKDYVLENYTYKKLAENISILF